MISPRDLRDYIVIPTLKFMEPEILYSVPAVQLMLGTFAKESEGGFWLDQTSAGPGPAYGINQMEQPTYYDHIRWMVSIPLNRPLFEKFLMIVPQSAIATGAARMRESLSFATFMTRIHYLRAPGAIPTTRSGQASYWKTHYNTLQGKGTTTQYIEAYNRLVGNAGEF